MGLGCETGSQPPLAGTDVPAASRIRSFSHPKPIKMTSVDEFTS
jgi:hypothetical protein